MASPQDARPAGPAEPTAAPPAGAPAPPPIDEAARRKIIVGIMAVMVLGALDQAIVATAMPTIGDALGQFELLPWVVTAFMVASTVTTPLYGKLADIHGRRPVLYFCMTMFLVGSVMCAVAPTMLTLIVGRAIQGLGGGGLMTIPQTIVADIIPPRERGRFQSYFAIGFASAMVAGPLLGGLFAAQLHWSLIFWINLPILAVSYAMMRGPLASLPMHHRPHRLDLLGFALMGLAAMALLLALDWGGTRYGWSSTLVLGLAGGSAVLWAGFGLRNMHSPEPLLPFDVLRDRVVSRASAGSFFAMGSFLGLMVSIPIYLEGVRGLSTGETALAFLVLTLGTVVGSANAGRLIKRVRRYRLLAAVGHAISALAMMVLALTHDGLPLFGCLALLGLTSAGIGTSFPIATVAVQNAVALHHMGIATAALGFVRSLGGAVGAALIGAIAFAGITPADRAMHVVAAGTADSFTFVFAAASIWACIAALCFFALEDRPLRSTVAPAGGADAKGPPRG